jgi:hypothetical protein
MRTDDVAYLQLLSGRSERLVRMLADLSIAQILETVPA